MSNLDDALKAVAANPGRGIFISRSGAEQQRQLAMWIAQRLKANGYIPILQDTDFKHTDFMLAMDATLASGVRVLALLSREYLESQHCMKEAMTALEDQRNASGRLVLLKIDDCRPLGLLRYLDRIDFAPVWRTGNTAEMERVLIAALDAPADLERQYLLPSAMDASQIVHPQVLMHDEDAFIGRQEDLKRLRDVLWNGGSAALTRAGARRVLDEAALAGMGGVGKTTLARAYAFRHRAAYHAVWWLRAETAETLTEDLIDLGKRAGLAGIDRKDGRDAAARETLEIIAASKANQPWLLVYDNAAGPGVVRPWRPERNAHVLVTSRNPDWDAAVPLDVLTPEAAVALLCGTAARKSEKDRAEAAALAEQLGRLPLALAHAASKCRGNRRIGFAAYGQRFTKLWAHRPDERSAHGKYPTSVYATFTLALDEIVNGGPAGDPAPCPDAETVIGVLAHLAPDKVPEHVLERLYKGDGAAMSEDAFDRALEELTAAGLVSWGEFEDGSPDLNMHRLVQKIVRDRLTKQGRASEIAALAVRAVHASFEWQPDSAAGMRANGRWLPHASHVLDFTHDAGGEDQSRATWIALFIGDHQLSRGSTDAAAASYQRAQALAQRLVDADPGNAGWQRDLSVSHERIGDVLAEQQNPQAALDAFQASFTLRERLAKADPWRRDLLGLQVKIGRAQRAQGSRAAALDAFRASLAIAERLAKAAPRNAEWQHVLCVTHRDIGELFAEQRDLSAALGAFRTSLAIVERLAKTAPGNARWRHLLSVSQDKIGVVLLERGDLTAARDAFQVSHTIAEGLVREDPKHEGWQRDLALSWGRIAMVLARQGRREEALEAFRTGRAIIVRLKEESPGNAALSKDLAWFYGEIAAL